jgi:DNA-directed RNA polymerase subunit omega
MARITVEDCLKRIPNRFTLVNMVAKRVRQIREGSELLVSSPKNEDIVVALREVAAGKISARDRMRQLRPEVTAELESQPETAVATPAEGGEDNAS